MSDAPRYYVSCLYGNWSVFQDGIQFASGFENEQSAKDWVEKICRRKG